MLFQKVPQAQTPRSCHSSPFILVNLPCRLQSSKAKCVKNISICDTIRLLKGSVYVLEASYGVKIPFRRCCMKAELAWSSPVSAIRFGNIPGSASWPVATSTQYMMGIPYIYASSVSTLTRNNMLFHKIHSLNRARMMAKPKLGNFQYSEVSENSLGVVGRHKSKGSSSHMNVFPPSAFTPLITEREDHG